MKCVVLPAVFILMCQYSCVSGFNIDTTRPIVRQPPTDHMPQVYDNFGYSGVLHSRTAFSPTTSTSDALDNSVIIVSAPNGSAFEGVLENTGVLFECPLTPGECSPFEGSGAGEDRRLYDREDNSEFELKEGQNLGISMDSTGDRFIVCAHRHRVIIEDSRDFRAVGGICYESGRGLTGFTRLEPCIDSDQNQQLPYRAPSEQCAAGSSVTLLRNRNVAFGAPAAGFRYRNFRGADIIYDASADVYRYSQPFDPEGHPITDEDSDNPASYSDYHRGYAIARGRIFTRVRESEDIIVGMPRGLRGSYLGAVGIHSYTVETRTLTIVNDFRRRATYISRLTFIAEGEQLASYFGGSVAAVDLNNDGFDEVLVGAPLYTFDHRGSPEAGKVTVYLNQQGTLNEQNKIDINGPIKAYARFGHAMTGIGDVNGDQFNDVAISAPFKFGADQMDNFAGAVYIYLGSVAGIQTTPGQVIMGNSLNLQPSILSGLVGFGAHLFSADVDNNGFQDLLIGAFQSRKVVVLRTRPILNIETSLTSNVTSVSEKDSCLISGMATTCFAVEVCFSLSGRGFRNNQLFDVKYNLTADARLTFPETGGSFLQNTILNRVGNAPTCESHLVLLNINVIDLDGPITVSTSPFLTDDAVQLSASNGNEDPADLADRPARQVSGQRLVTILPNLDCGDDALCQSDLSFRNAAVTPISRLNMATSFSEIIIGQVTDVVVSFRLVNTGIENAYRPVTVISYSRAFSFSRIEGNNAISCTQNSQNENLNTLSCTITDRLASSADVMVNIRLVVLDGRLTGQEGTVTFSLNVSSNSIEVNAADNIATLSASVISLADAQSTMSTSSSQFVSQSGPGGQLNNINNVTDIGRRIIVNVTAINHGPSVVRNGRLDAYWPIAHRCSGRTNFLFYLTSINLIGLQGRCEVFPPEALDYFQLATSQSGDGDIEVSVSGAGKLLSNLTHPFTSNMVTMETGTGSIDCGSSDVTFISVDCRNQDDYCVRISCDITSHQPNTRGALSITGNIDDSFFASQQRDWRMLLRSNYTITDTAVSEVTGAGSRGNEGEVVIRVISRELPTINSSVPIWVIILPIVLALVAIVTTVVILYCCGFFKRKHWKKLQEEKTGELNTEYQNGESTVEEQKPGDNEA